MEGMKLFFFGNNTRKKHDSELCDSLLSACQDLQTCFWH